MRLNGLIRGLAVVVVVLAALVITHPNGIDAQRPHVWMRDWYHIAFTFPTEYDNGAPVETGLDIMELFIEVDMGDGEGFVPFGDGTDGVPGRYDTRHVAPGLDFSIIVIGQPPDQEWLWRATTVRYDTEGMAHFGPIIEAVAVVRQYPANPPGVEPRPIARTDVNGDGHVNAPDLQLVINEVLNRNG